MKNFIPAGRCFYGIGIAGIGIQQFIYSDFRPFILEYWPSWVPGVSIWAYLCGAALIIAGAIICFGKNARFVSIVLGSFFFLNAFSLVCNIAYTQSCC